MCLYPVNPFQEDVAGMAVIKSGPGFDGTGLEALSMVQI
jgi:hypothetical protein